MCTAVYRNLRWTLGIAWDRTEPADVAYAIVGTSLVNGTDLVQGEQGSLTKSENFVYYNETSRVIRLEYDRAIEEPLGGISQTLADLLLDNTDLRFTPYYNATAFSSAFPNRPARFYIGLNVEDEDKTVPIFKGLTINPKESKHSRTYKSSCGDYIAYLNGFALTPKTYVSQRTDQIIADILSDVGFGVTQYELDTGLNTITFAWFSTGQTAGERIRAVCESEEGNFYQDEDGILRFENRKHIASAPHDAVVWTIHKQDIIEWEYDNPMIINNAIVRASPRRVQSIQNVYPSVEDQTLYDTQYRELPPGDTDIWISLIDPCNSLTAPAQNTDFLANADADGGGANRTAQVTTAITSFIQSAKITFTNADAGTVYITKFKVRGTPATVISDIVTDATDNRSVDKYNEQTYVVNNDLITSQSDAQDYADHLVNKYKDPMKRIKITIQGIPQLQLKDKITVSDMDLETTSDYRIMRIIGQLDNGGFTQILYLREILSTESD